MENTGKIYELIGKAMAEIGAIGKDSRNAQQGFMYRGIDAVYNALNPVMAKYGLFITPTVLDMKREDRLSANGKPLIHTILTMEYKVFAPDGSFISCTVIGEGMDSGDKSTNKAMSVAMKYAMFQLFFIATEELKDPDADSYNDVLPRGQQPQNAQRPAQAAPATVTTGNTIPSNVTPIKQTQPKQLSPVHLFINEETKKIAKANPGFDLKSAREQLIKDGVIEDIKGADMTMEDAQKLIAAIKSMLGY